MSAVLFSSDRFHGDGDESNARRRHARVRARVRRGEASTTAAADVEVEGVLTANHGRLIDWQTVAERHNDLPLAERMTEIPAEYPVSFVGGGNDRDVYAVDPSAHPHDGDVVLKIDKPEAWNTAGRETATWRAVQGTAAARWFAPVLDSGDGWLVMRRADGGEGDVVSRVEAAFDRLGLPTGDVTAANVGMLDGEPVCVDYPFGDVSLSVDGEAVNA